MPIQFRLRTLFALVVVVLLSGSIAASTAWAARKDKKADKQDEKNSKGLPLKKVVMFTSGMGFFEHRGQVEADARVELKFNVQNVNDLLKSMVLEDEGGGRISTVTYGSRDP